MVKHKRRYDLALRKAIDTIQSKVSDYKHPDHLFCHSLETLCDLYESCIGFAVRVTSYSHRSDKVAHLNALCSAGHLVDLGVNQIEKKSSEFSGEFIDDFTALLETSELREALCQRHASVLPKRLFKQVHEQLKPQVAVGSVSRLLVLPVVDAVDLFGIFCIGVPAHTDAELIMERAWPLLTSVACLARVLLKPQSNNPNIKEEFGLDGPRSDQMTLEKLRSECLLPLVEVNRNLTITRMNQAAIQLFELGKESAQGMSLSAFIPEKFINQHKTHSFSLLPDSDPTTAERYFEGRSMKGDLLKLNVKSISYHREKGAHRLLMIEDLSQLDTIKKDHEAEVQRFKVVSDLAPVGILQTNAQWEAVYTNNRWYEICQREADEVPANGWICVFHQEDVFELLEQLRTAVIQGVEFAKQTRLQSPMGDVIWVEFLARPIITSEGNTGGFISTITDYTYRYEAEQRLRRLAERDTLTGLANRVLFQDRLSQALARVRRNGTLALLSLDLDGFKHVNDNLGHDVGDHLLTEVANRLTACVRETDTVARMGGDEFLILLEDVEQSEIAARISEKVLGKMAEPFRVQRQEVFISGSIGITFANQTHNPQSVQNLLKQADIALYKAKDSGRNNYQYYAKDLEIIAKDRLYLGNSLHRALERKEFLVYYQLQRDLKSDQIVGAEALLRWNHPERGVLSPKDFIDLLEESGLIVSVSLWMMREAFRQHKVWVNMGVMSPEAHVAINWSPRLLHSESFLPQFEALLNESGLTGKQVVVEITESVLLESSKNVEHILISIRDMGISIALDDFGTGYSSLSYLKKFPIDCLKIDQSFIQDMLNDPEDEAITEGILRLAQSLNLRTVAEGVDSDAITAKLKEWGCGYYQGYALNKPTPPLQTVRLLKSLQDISETA